MKSSSVAVALLPLAATLQLALAEPNCTVPAVDRVISTACGPVICGSNNITYDNEDAFEWATCDFPGLTVAAKGAACPGNETECSKSAPESGSAETGSGDGAVVPSPTKEKTVVGGATPEPTKKSSVATGLQMSATIAFVGVSAILAALA
ncbi:hypothetical protein PINS_up018378 [Pythium insidiosum]|nr:hypothetical protein PINS_up018378 [Pythium insidiosum]